MLCKRFIANYVSAGFGEMVEAVVAQAVWRAEPQTVADVLPVSLPSPTPSDGLTSSSVSRGRSEESLDIDLHSLFAAEAASPSSTTSQVEDGIPSAQRSVNSDGPRRAPSSESDSKVASAPLSDG